MQSKLKGFSVWELLIVFTVLSILGAIAIPKIFALRAEEKVSEFKEICKGLTDASAANYKIRKEQPLKGKPIKDCKDVVNLVSKDALNHFKILATPALPHVQTPCTLTKEDLKGNFVVMGIV